MRLFSILIVFVILVGCTGGGGEGSRDNTPSCVVSQSVVSVPTNSVPAIEDAMPDAIANETARNDQTTDITVIGCSVPISGDTQNTTNNDNDNNGNTTGVP